MEVELSTARTGAHVVTQSRVCHYGLTKSYEKDAKDDLIRCKLLAPSIEDGESSVEEVAFTICSPGSIELKY
ncbi:unnamed protein product [Strongylus vulgaris]|uniref:Uncharacterized protein n=1 Tax=Strongylus vulgaris TaxID=40348 RepID=A0A3P7IQF1_STRVU|nr:unnamed protein product [Strongylus vulgaris]